MSAALPHGALATPRRVPWPDVALFLALAYALSWWPWPLSVLSTRADAAVLIPIGPSLAALVVLLVRRRGDDVRRLLRSTLPVRIGRLWWVLTLPVALAAATLAVAVGAGAPAPPVADLLVATAVGVAGLPLTLVLAGPLGEELGWRGYLLPVLLRRFTPFAATVAVTAAWITFHLPLIVTEPDRYGPGWALALLGVALVMTRLHLAGGDLALAVAFHAAVNTTTAIAIRSIPEPHRPLAWVVTGLLWLGAALVLELHVRTRGPRVPSLPRRTAHRSSEPPMNVVQAGRPSVAARTRRAGIAVAALAVMQFVLVLDSAIVNVALATVGRDLAAPPDRLTWVVNAYALAFGGLLLLGGRLADLAGARRLFVLGTALFGLASFAGAFASTIPWLIASRAAQGVGAALAAPAALALLVSLFPDGAQRGKALGLFGVMAGAGGSAGLLLGGLLTETLGWRSVLWINVPVVLAVLVAAVTLPAAGRSVARKPLDVPGAVTATAAISLLVYAVIEAPARGWVSIPTLSVLAAAGLLFVAFTRIEAAAAEPLLPRALGRAAGLRSANVAAALMMAAMFPMWFLLTLYLQQDLGRSPVAAGLAVLPLSLTMMATNGITPRAVARFGSRAVLTAGLLLAAVGLAGLAATVTARGDEVALVLPSIVTGLGFGLAFVAGVVAATAPAPVDHAGTASGLVNTSQQVGGALGLAALLSLAVALARPASPGAEDLAAALLGAAILALGAAAVAMRGGRAPSTDPATPARAALRR